MDLKQYVVVYAPATAVTFGREELVLPMVLKDKPDFLKGVLNLPGGKIEGRETPIDAAMRELKEETGLLTIGTPLLMGVIRGTKSEIHVVRCPAKYQTLTPAEGETEIFSWHHQDFVIRHSSLMPNLRLILPLCYSGAIGWRVFDDTGDWRGMYHRIQLELDKSDYMLEVKVHGMSYFKE